MRTARSAGFRVSLAALLATLLNLLLVSLPLCGTDLRTRLLADPRLWLFAALIAAFTLLEGRASRATAGAMPTGARAVPLPYLTGPALLGVFWLSLYGSAAGGTGLTFTAVALASAGALAMAAGIALRLAAIRTLQHCFTSHVALDCEHTLVTGGLYARLRHPSELGLLLAAFGAALLLASSAGWIFAAAVLLPLSLYRIHLEDQMLSAAFGERFRRYAAGTPALLPRLRRAGAAGGESHRFRRGSRR